MKLFFDIASQIRGIKSDMLLPIIQRPTSPSWNFILFSASFFAMLAYSIGSGELVLHGDVKEVWSIAGNFWDPQREKSYVEYRGPFTFIFYAVMHDIAIFLGVNPLSVLRIVNSLMFSTISTIIIPYIFSFIYSKKVAVFEIFIFSILVFSFFGGYFLYPLTDFPAFFFLLLSIAAVISINNRRGNILALIVLSVVSFSCSVMMRSSYIAAGLFVVIFLLKILRSYAWGWRRLLGVSAAFALVSFILIGWNKPDDSSNYTLLTRQLHGGMKFQKVEWNAGDEKYPAQMWIRERRGEQILRDENLLEVKEFTISQYFDLVKKYPIDMLLINARHLFGGLDVIYSTVYIYDFKRPRFFLSLVNYSLIFLAISIIGEMFRNWRNKGRGELLVVSALVCQSILAVPLIGEVRFFMPTILTLAGISIFSAKNGSAVILRKGFIAHCFFFVALCFLASASIFEFETAGKVILFNAQ